MTDGLRLTVLGSGYLGITHAACMASLGCLSTSPAWKSSCARGSTPGG